MNSRGPWTTIVFGFVGRFVHDRDLARLDDVERHAALPGLEDDLPVFERAELGQAGQAFDFGFAQSREREVMSVILGSPTPRPPVASRIAQSLRRGSRL